MISVFLHAKYIYIYIYILQKSVNCTILKELLVEAYLRTFLEVF